MDSSDEEEGEIHPNTETRAENKVSFIVEDDDNKDQLFDPVCCMCDDGGDLLGCEGSCLRSFHMILESGDFSSCETLCYTTAQVEVIQTFLCKNCQYQRHQCFKCGRLGSSDRLSGAEVFPCVSATCGYFYHPKCVAEIVFPNDDVKSQDFQKRIEQGDSFVCPCHKCLVCNQVENKQVPELQFAVCRRCPKAYHRKCLPKNYLFESDEEKGIPQRAWENLLNKRILIYCIDHKIYRSTLTPKRDHLLFPDVRRNEQGEKLLLETRSKAFGNRVKMNEGEKHSKGSNTIAPKNIGLSNQIMPNKLPIMDYRKLQQKHDQPVSMLGMKRAYMGDVPTGDTRRSDELEMQNRIRKMVESSTASFNFEEFVNQQTRNMGHFNSSNSRLDKTITMGKVEHSVKAVEAALNIIQNGGSIEDAKSVCEPGVLIQMMKWKNKLAVYLSPFLHGKRYTSFGRHFTNREKLKEIVNRLCWYVKDGDTIVDFGCGSNDFSCLMKEKLDFMGRQCNFKNYDLIQPKNDFNYEKRDWMSIRLDELPEGSNLIIGLNPPFGVHASLANQFIDKALTFRPKLLILIVPKKTHGLTRKHTPYDLVWVDDRILAGKSFYLPGSIGVNGEQLEQWNNETVPLFLWSRPDWTAHHRTIALEQGHIIINPPPIALQHSHVINPAIALQHGHVINPATALQHGHVINPAIALQHGHVINPAIAPHQGHIINPAIALQHSHVYNPAIAPQQGHIINPAIALQHGHVINPAIAPQQGHAINPAIALQQGYIINPEMEYSNAISANVIPNYPMEDRPNDNLDKLLAQEYEDDIYRLIEDIEAI